jgi:CHAT domain-containing protein
VGPHRALLAYFWGDDAVFGWWIGPDTVRALRLGPADSLAALVSILRDLIAQPTRDSAWRGPAHEAYRRLVAPVAGPPVEDLLVLPDGPLAYLPLEALLPTPAGPPLGFTHRVIYGPSGSVLLALARAGAGETWERSVLAVGNPSPPASPPPDGDALRGRPLDPLPAAEDEARAVYHLLGAGQGDLLLGRRATRDRWLDREPGRYRYLHFAAHALVDDARPDRTRLVLAGGDLTLADIRRLTLTAQLVTLSACETALGPRVRGEGVIGLPHAFLAAGARETMVSLWRVGDRPTAQFMREFYAELAAGRPAADALQAVRRRRITQDAAPATWASFILVGGTP